MSKSHGDYTHICSRAPPLRSSSALLFSFSSPFSSLRSLLFSFSPPVYSFSSLLSSAPLRLPHRIRHIVQNIREVCGVNSKKSGPQPGCEPLLAKSERGDSNARPLRPERSALPTALLSDFLESETDSLRAMLVLMVQR